MERSLTPRRAERSASTACSFAATGGRPVGWAYTTRCGQELCVGQISVRADQQRRGIGSQLMRRIIADAEAAGESSLVLNTQADVVWNRPWYESIGFRVVRPEDWTDGMRAIVDEQAAEGLDWSTACTCVCAFGADPAARTDHCRGGRVLAVA